MNAIIMVWLLLLRSSNVELKMNDVAIFNDILLPFLTKFTRLLDLSHGRFGGDALEIVEGAYFSLDETAFEIRVNHSGGLRGGGAVVYGPASDFFLYRAVRRKEFSFRAVSRESVGIARKEKENRHHSIASSSTSSSYIFMCAPPAVK
jgi:hypothetical protein